MTKTTVSFCVKCMPLLCNRAKPAVLPSSYISTTVADPPTSSLQIKVTANKTKQPFCMKAKGWQMRKCSYNSHIHQN